MSQRRRVRASDIASPNPRKGLLALGLIGIALILILFFKGSFGDSTAGFMEHLTYDPDLELPQSATERAKAGPSSGGASSSAAPTSAKPTIAAPVSAAPSSAAPTSAMPVSIAPTSAAPPSDVPTP